MKTITITKRGFVSSLPTSADKPGRYSGFTRDGVMSHVFELAGTYGYEIRVAGQHWPSTSATATVSRLASDKLSGGYRALSERPRRVRHAELMAKRVVKP